MTPRAQVAHNSLRHVSFDYTRHPPNACFIYVMGQETIDPRYGQRIVTIGKAGNLENLKQRQYNHSRRGSSDDEMMRCLAVLWGMENDEKYIHKSNFFERVHKRVVTYKTGMREWYFLDQKLTDWLFWLRQQPYVSVLPSPDPEMNELPYIADPSIWLPPLKLNKNKADGQFKWSYVNGSVWADFSEEHITEGDYFTPDEWTKAAHEAMDGIDLDPASCRWAQWGDATNHGVRAKEFFYASASRSGLERQWHGNVWLNPPFGQWPLWCSHIIHELEAGRVKQIIVTMPATATTNQNTSALVKRGRALLVPHRRPDYWGPKATSATEGSQLLYIGNRVPQFKAAFERRGIGKVFVG